jgi:P-type Cu2+ transporter
VDTQPAYSLQQLDSPQEWLAFSQPLDDSPPETGQWESKVLVKGMYCAACALAVEEALTTTPGVISARVSAASGQASVMWSASQTRPSKWLVAADKLGYSLLAGSDTVAPATERQEAKEALWRWLVAGFCMMQVMMYATPSYFSSPGDISPDLVKLLRWASWVLTLPVIFFSGVPFFSQAWRDLKARSISMQLPVALGIAVTFAISTAATFEPEGWWGQEVYFDSLTMFVFFLLSGRWLELRLRQRTAGALSNLMHRLPVSVARLLPNGHFERIAMRQLKVGDVVQVLPGEAFPADGQTILGDTYSDEALLTGESRPIAKPVGSAVLAGSYNRSAPVQVRIGHLGKDTRYAQIVALMDRASLDKPRLAVLADRIARPFLLFVLVAAAGAAAFWWSTDPARALMAAVAVLVVTCPCALSLATPTAMLTSAGLWAKHGVLVRNLQAIESLAEIDTVIFDKTGTLTDATIGLHAVQTRSGISQNQALLCARALAQYSLHPISRALVLATEQLAGEDLSHVAQYEVNGAVEVPGQGIQAVLTGAHPLRLRGVLRLGSASFTQCDEAVDSQRLVLADSDGWIATFELAESAKTDAAQTIESLKKLPLNLMMLSGDSDAAARLMANRLGISQAWGGCTPQSKHAQLLGLQQAGKKVLMVGDGLNDGPVLAGANVSIAVGDAVPLSQSQSDFVMPGNQLLVLPQLIVHARRTMAIVRQNLWWAASYNALCVPLALAGWLPAWLAGLGMATSSFLVLANAARLAQFKGQV